MLDDLPKPFFVLAPMDDITDVVFRRVVSETAPPDLYFTEFVNVDGLQSIGREKLLHKLLLGTKENNVVAQIWGKDPENYYKTTKELIGGQLAKEARDHSQKTYLYNKIIKNKVRPQKEKTLQASINLDPKEFVEIKNLDKILDLSEVQRRDENQTNCINDTMSETRSSLMQQFAKSKNRVAGSASEQVFAINNFVGVDINMGCPDKAVIKNGCCGALINDRVLAKKIIEAVQTAVKESRAPFPVSVKCRVGFTTVDLSWIELLLEQKLNMLSIHLRTVKDMSKIPARWELMEQIAQMKNAISPTTLLVGNGDVASRKQGEELAKKYDLDGIMIGRGIFDDPYVFAAQSTWQSIGRQQKIELYKKHVQVFADTWQNNERRVATLNKFCKIYINGFSGAKELREKLMSSKTTDELIHKLS